jgi:hypothetical protein
MMENENFDEELKNRIKQIFEEQDNEAADKGWDLLREKYPEKKHRDYLFWWLSSAAALLLIAFIFWLFPFDFYQKNASKIVKQQKPVTNKVSSDTINSEKTPVKTASDFADQHSPEKNKITQSQIYADAANAKKTPVKTASDFISTLKLQPETTIVNQNNTSFTGIKTDSIETNNQQKFAIVSKDSSAQKALVAVIKKPNPILVKPTVKKYSEAEISKKTTEKSSVFSLEVYAGSHVNYATGSTNQLGLGAGISTDFRLSKNFKLSTGLGLMQNNLTYGQDIPSGSLDAASSSYSVMPASGSGLVTSIQTPSLNTMGTRLLALDVPINLVYNISPGKNSISVSAGVSSNTFVKEAYDYHYSNSTNTTQNIKSFNNFNFAKTLNLAAGFAYPLGKSQLQIEPFLKYPLGGSGSQQLQFGSAGINLKMNISTFKSQHK